MSPVSWMKKKLRRRKSARSAVEAVPLFPRPDLPADSSLSVPMVEREIHIAAADLRSANSHKTADMFSNIDDLESIVLHIKENKVTLIRRKSMIITKVSSRRSAANSATFYRNLYRRATRIARFSSLTCLGINGMILPHKTKYVF